mmetsp:Transcript_66378/g.167284  ORF Transcript_66378/g.167284 Transcript_66378/m.167284 type:complete len:334 (-) Transcript_66378:9-1010(-)
MGVVFRAEDEADILASEALLQRLPDVPRFLLLKVPMEVLVGLVPDGPANARTMMQPLKPSAVHVPLAVARISRGVPLVTLVILACIFVRSADLLRTLWAEVEDGGRVPNDDAHRQVAMPRHPIGALRRHDGPAHNELAARREAADDDAVEVRVLILHIVHYHVQRVEAGDSLAAAPPVAPGAEHPLPLGVPYGGPAVLRDGVPAPVPPLASAAGLVAHGRRDDDGLVVLFLLHHHIPCVPEVPHRGARRAVHHDDGPLDLGALGGARGVARKDRQEVVGGEGHHVRVVLLAFRRAEELTVEGVRGRPGRAGQRRQQRQPEQQRHGGGPQHNAS